MTGFQKAVIIKSDVNHTLKEGVFMKRIVTINTRDLAKSVENGGCGECQTSCQSACKTSCGIVNQQCEQLKKEEE